ncbi:hypothetical protein HanXRQr2_Chr12g0528251 [Helianthus annuus]|uniref:Uncharacterized protein n=1 Tax=Helianthus annuus TaxID=4232 RepID=A0A9K3EQ20_HELAN|nr:hypothetical protein HanXRQr2_Chr12g0528251 [Helianthus annuus]
MQRRPSPLSIKSKALSISENGTSCVINFSTSITLFIYFSTTEGISDRGL